MLPEFMLPLHVQTRYCQLWADFVLETYRPIRRKRPASLAIWKAEISNSGELCTPASSKIARLTEHELIDLSVSLRQAQCGKKGRPKLTKNLSIPKGKCHFSACPAAHAGYSGPLPKRPCTKCMSCCNGKGAYYHLQCFFRVHRCVLEDK